MRLLSKKLKATVALYTIALMVFGMFCIGMFIAPAPVKAQTELACHNHAHSLSNSKNYFSKEAADCCFNRPYNSQAIISPKDIDGNHLLPTAILALSNPVAPDFYYQTDFSLKIFPPPEGEALRSIIKKE